MRHFFLLLVATTLLGCGDPLASLDRISDVELAEDPAAQALPSEEEVAREGFFGTAAAASPDDPPLATPEPRRGGFLGLFRRPPVEPEPQTAVVDGLTPEPATDGVEGAVPPATDAPPAEPQELAALTPEPEAGPRRGGFLGLFSRASAPAGASTGSGGPPASDLPEVAYGTVIPYGQIARSCDARGKSLGTKIENVSARGYKLYDSAPGAEGLRTYYITGFPDGCPRQITAANVLIGTPSFYEKLHYGPAGAHLASGETDAAYERVKRRICGKSKGRPCGGKIGEMDRTTFFINSYPRLGSTPRWSEVLIHKGEVVASGFKSAG